MEQRKPIQIADKVIIRDFTDTKFKTMRISVNFILPLSKESASANALIPSVVTRATSQYPSITLLSQYLSELYGADFNCSVAKAGDNQVLSISASGISDKYALNNENISEEFAKLLCESLFEPLKDDTGNFLEDVFEQEKRQIDESIDADFNDKKVYSKIRCTEIMYAGEPAENNKYGSKDTLNAIKREDLITVLNSLLETAKIEILVLGDCNVDLVADTFKKYFNIKRNPVALAVNSVMKAEKVKEETEELKLAQSKLVIGFRTGVVARESYATRVMCVLLGGSVSSKFFLNVREKLSLCYYCSSTLNVEKSSMFIESGIETVNIDKAKEAIFNELNDVKNGVFTDDDIQYAKLAMLNSYNAINDSLYAIESWYSSQFLNEEFIAPEEIAEKIKNISREEIIEAANKLSLDTVYVLKGVNENE